jgi:hypothetical protein
MRTFVAAIAMLAMLATAVCAADDSPPASPLVGKFPDTLNDCHVYLFMLKKNNITVKDGPHEFCKKMDYGDAAFWHQPNEIGPDEKSVTRGNLDWVICRFGKATNCNDPGK